MELAPREKDKLLLFLAAELAQKRKDRVKLNYPESTALICAFILEGARDGRSVADLMNAGREVLNRDDVMDGIAEMLPEVQVEATFLMEPNLSRSTTPLRSGQARLRRTRVGGMPTRVRQSNWFTGPLALSCLADRWVGTSQNGTFR